MAKRSLDHTLLAAGSVVVAVLVFLELWVETAGAILAYATAAMLISERRHDQEERRARTYSRSVSTSTPS